MLAEDVVTGLRYVKEKEEKLRTDGTAAEITLVGHSSGGGLAQLVLSKQLTRVRALILVGAIPCFGSAEVAEFESLMPEYESLNWPIGMLRPFINVRRVLAGISGWDSGERIMVVAGGLDRICSVPLMRRMAQQYRTAVGDLVKEKKIDETEGAVGDAEEAPVEKCTESRGAGVRFTIVEGAGHHVQNDLQRDDGARRILDFVKQLDGE
ncbi:MAG: hypothetical protein M1837_001197 [Sclerophora amabilis]|nr:MAG: hypothetical protein M1837_001197 [Sclerophora amabilis]